MLALKTHILVHTFHTGGKVPLKCSQESVSHSTMHIIILKIVGTYKIIVCIATCLLHYYMETLSVEFESI